MIEQDKKELHIAGVDFPEAKQLGDIASILMDLQTVVEMCKRIAVLLESKNEDHILMDALWSMSLVRYVRCFTSGKRYGLKMEELFNNLKGDPIGAHQFYKNMRDKHVAHSVNPYEQMHVGLVLSPPDSEKQEVVGVSILHGTYLCPQIDGVKQLGTLAEVALNHVRNIGKEYQDLVMEKGKKLPIGDLYAQAQSKFVAPPPDLSGKGRNI
ncbi:MAG: hypothetical protein Q7J31_19310 [Syntrophales bacterium]|nr:hypothetical protein [Syntrophales bacterium]